jgi:hypothetical protein
MFWEGKPLTRVWEPVHVFYYRTTGKSCDFPSLHGYVPVFTTRAWGVLQPLIGHSVEALPLVCDTRIVVPKRGDKMRVPAGPFGPFYAINVLNFVDCLDYDHSEIVWFSHGVVMLVESYAFKNPGLLRGKHIFRLPETRALEVLVSDEFKNTVEKNNLVGLEFPKLGSVEL